MRVFIIWCLIWGTTFSQLRGMLPMLMHAHPSPAAATNQELRWLDLRMYEMIEFQALVQRPEMAMNFDAVKVTTDKDVTRTFVQNIEAWTHLRALDLSFCDFKKIPKWVTRLKHLEFLDLSGNALSNAHDFAYPPTLYVLALEGCGLEMVPTTLRALKNLRLLGLGFNASTMTLPKWLVERQQAGQIRIRGMFFDD